MGKVYIVNEPARFNADDAGRLEQYAKQPLASGGASGVPVMNLSPAEEYGDLVFLLPSGRVPRNPQTIVVELEKGLMDFDHNEDYLLPIGDMTACMIAAAIISYQCHGVFQTLRWNRDVRRYAKVSIDVTGHTLGEAHVTRK